MQNETVEEKKQKLIKVLSNNVNSGNVTEIIEALDSFVTQKIQEAIELHENKNHDVAGAGF